MWTQTTAPGRVSLYQAREAVKKKNKKYEFPDSNNRKVDNVLTLTKEQFPPLKSPSSKSALELKNRWVNRSM